MSGQAANVVLPDDLVQEIDDLVGTSGRGEFLAGLGDAKYKAGCGRRSPRHRRADYQLARGWQPVDNLPPIGGALWARRAAGERKWHPNVR